jgi:hypothetical protein
MFRPLTARASATAAAVILALAAGAGPASAKNDGAAGGATPGNPPGNNGTVKIDSTPFDDHPDNEPHVTCTFQVDFYNFDQGDLWADVSFDLQAPTGSGHLAATPERVFIGQDPAGGHDGGDDLDASQTYDLSGALAASGAQPHPQQGYHVKLTIHADGSQGADVKHKVFWIEPCGGAAPGEVAADTGGHGGGHGGTNGGQSGAVGGTVTPAPSGGAEVAGEARAQESAVLGETIERSAPAGGTGGEVLGVQYSRGVLARTGMDIGLTTGFGLVLLVLGLALRRTAARASA